jgi:hypothetical protein
MKLLLLHRTRVRIIVRNCIALSFWMHAAYVSNLVIPHTAAGPHWSQYLYNSAILGFIFFYSFCGDNEWFSVVFDALYVYFWPFVITSKVVWFGLKGGYRYLQRKIVWRAPSFIVLPTPKPPVIQPVAKEAEKKTHSASILEMILRPFRQFVVLWAALVISADSKFFIAFASTITLIGAGSAVYRLWNVLSNTSSWIEKMKDSFARQIADNIMQVRAWKEGSDLQDVTKAANALKSLEAMFTFISANRDFLSKSTMVVAAIISIPFYCYISFLFSCTYVGLAKLQNIPFAWPSALIDSLYMPFAFTNLPSNFAIQLLGGLQALIVTLIGWNIFFRHLSDRFMRITKAASELCSPFEDALFRAKLDVIENAVNRIEASDARVIQHVIAQAGTMDTTAAMPAPKAPEVAVEFATHA